MSVQVIAHTGTGQSGSIKPFSRNPFNIGFGVVVSGTVTYTVEHSFNGVDFFDHEFVVAQTSDADGNYAFPVSTIRINVTAGSGTATLTSIQAG